MIKDRAAGPPPPIVRHHLTPGAFIVCTQIGGFADPSTSLFIPGPKAITEPITRSVVELVEFPDPVQLPHRRMTLDEKTGEWLEVAFNHVDSLNSQDCLQLALDTGILRIVDDEIVRESFPNAWAKRKDRVVFDPREKNRPTTALLDLFDRDFEKAREAAKQAHKDAEAAAG